MIDRIKGESSELKKEIREKTVGYIVASLGLVAGLAWNEAIRSMIDYWLPSTGSGIWAKLIYAVLITLIVVIISSYLLRLSRKDTPQS